MEMNKTNLYIYGAAGHAKMIADMAEDSAWEIAGAFDKNLLRETLLDQYPVHMGLAAVDFEADAQFVIGIVNNEYRKRIAEQELQGRSFATLQDKTVSLSKYAEVEEGSVMLPFAVIAADVQVGRHCIIGAHVSIDHDAVIEDYVHISAGARIGGEVLIGEGTQIGTAVSVAPGVNIGKWCHIEAGAVLTEDVMDGVTVQA